jgi:hypothetical protein
MPDPKQPILDSFHCPVCKELYVTRVRTLHVQSTCVNNHTWHVCPMHKSIVLGAYPNGSASACSCGKDWGRSSTAKDALK